MLRSIFVTHCERAELSEAQKESLAAAMSHSSQPPTCIFCCTPLSTNGHSCPHSTMFPQAQSPHYQLHHSSLQQKDHYDRRTQVDKEAKGQQYASTLLEKAMMAQASTEPGPSRLSEPIVVSDDDLNTPGVGDIVAIILPTSTPHQPAFELGKVLSMSNNGSQLKYLPLENVGGSHYRCTAGCLGRAATDMAVYPIGTDYDDDTKTYTLLSDAYAIHMAHATESKDK